MQRVILSLAILAAMTSRATASDVREDAVGAALKQSMIWLASAPTGKQVYVAFRKTFDLEGPPSKASLDLFADSRYILHINGQYVERGPCRFDPIAPEYDTLDVCRFLRRGRNVVTVLVHHYTDGKTSGHGDFCGRIMRHAPGLTARLTLTDDQGARRTLITDPSWRATSKTRFGPSPFTWAGIPDNIDARLDDGDWTQADYNDAAWNPAAPVDGKQWGPLRARSIPLLREREMAPLTAVGLPASPATPPGWIWMKEKDYPAQKAPRWSAPEGVRYFRKIIDLPRGASDVTIHITADNEFDVFFNGKKVAENHEASFGAWATMRRVDLTPIVVAGRNTVAVRAVNKHYGDISDPAGLIVVMTWRDGNETRRLTTDGTWQAADNAPDGWERPDYDSATWPGALVLCPYGQGAWQTNISNFPGPASAVLSQKLETVLPLDLAAGQELVVDAGAADQAYSVLDVDAPAGTSFEVIYAQRFFDSGRQPSDFSAQRCLYTTRAGRQTYMSGDTFGFKYLALRVKNGTLKLHGLRIVSRRYPFDRVGRFTCNDSMLNRIWMNSVHTVMVCSEDAYVDCATRERVEWLGDGVIDCYPMTRIALAGPGSDGKPRYGDPRLLRNMLRHIAQSGTPDGRLKAHHPSDRWDIHGYIEDYACLWVNGLRSYYDNTGDADLIREVWAPLAAQMKWFLDHRTPHGLVKAREFVFPGNPLVYKVCEGATLNAYVCHALRDAADMAKVIGHKTLADEYRREAAAIQRSLNEHLWDATSGTYFGAIMDNAKTSANAHAAALCLYHNVVPADRIESVRRWLLANHRKGGFAPYTHQFLFKAIYEMDTDATDGEVLAVIRDFWAAMARGETNTVWESFGGGEFIHQMGSAPGYYLSAYVLGVRLTGTTTDRRLIVEPRLGNLTEVSGVVVTELGPVDVSWKRVEDGKALEFTIDNPTGIKAEVSIPWPDPKAHCLVGNKDVPWKDRSRAAGQTGRPYVTFELDAGRHQGRIGR